MLRRSFAPLWMRATAVSLQGWGGGSGSGGGWGTSDSAASSGGGGWGAVPDSGAGGGWGSTAGKPTGNGGWGSADGAADASAGGAWGNAQGSPSGWGSGGGGDNGDGPRGRRGGGRDRGWGGRDNSGGWGSQNNFSGGGGGWGSSDGGSGGGGFKNGWGSEGGWGDAPTGSRQRSSRGNYRRGRQGRQEGDGIWGKPAAADEAAWNAAPPSFQPPVRRVDPLSLTAVEVEVDGVKKLVGQRVQVSGLSDDTTWHTLKDHLRQAGDVTFCRVYSGGRGMVEFATPEEAARCITELQASELEGATLYLREDREDTVLINTRRKIREAREAQLRARKEEAEKARRAKAAEQGDVPASPPSSSTTRS
ncbi:RNA binding protein rggm [Lotmaria passim]